jgi:carbon catabolite-derepressing protein kinase
VLTQGEVSVFLKLEGMFVLFGETVREVIVIFPKIYKGEFKCPRWMIGLQRFLSKLLDTNSETQITVDGINRDPWFRKGYKEIKFYEEDYGYEYEFGFRCKCDG